MTNIVDSVIQCMPYFKMALREDVAMSVFGRDQVLYHAEGEKLKFGVKAGDPMFEANRDFKDLKGGKVPVTAHFSDEIFGIPFDTLFIPILSPDDEVLAILTVNYSMENKSILSQLMKETEEVTTSILSGIQQVAAHSEELSATSEEILVNSKHAVENSKSITHVTNVIREISEQTNLLGLNAAIEAARVGAAGAGFDVVAKEIRKLSVTTKDATSKIEQSIRSVQQSIQQMETEITQITAASRDQAALVSQFMESIERMNDTSNKLKEFFNKLVAKE